MDVAGVPSLIQVKTGLKRINELYAQVGLLVSPKYSQLPWPNNLPRNKPGFLDLYDEIPGKLIGPLSYEYKKFIDFADSEGLNVYFVLSAYSTAFGIAVTPHQILREPDGQDLPFKYLDKAFINTAITGPTTGYTTSHELLHLLAYRTDGQHDHNEPFWNLLNVTNQNKEAVLRSVRITKAQEGRILEHPALVR